METAKNDIITVMSPQDYLPPDQVKAVQIDLQEAKEKAVSLRVVTDEDMDEANAVCGKIRARQKGIEQFRLAIVKPFKDHIAKIDKFFKDLQTQFDPPRAALEDKVLKCRERKIEAERKERERLEREAREKEAREKEKLRIKEEEARKKEEEARAAGRQAEAERQAAEAARLKKQKEDLKVEAKETTKAAPTKSSYQEGVGRTTFVKEAEYRIEDMDQLPEEFWIVDDKKLGARVRELKKDLEVGKVYRDKIAGVVITCTERPSYAGEKP